MNADSDSDDSLFGSPPPSPQQTGRETKTKNVGTIALPGSQPHSEYPINPLALSLNHGIVHRPPAPPPAPTPTPAPALALAPTPTPAGPGPTKQPQPRKPRKKPTKKLTSVPPPEPEFRLPDPSTPLPSHFLRNQENLLGKAGRVARLKPPPTPSGVLTRGATPSNPILIPDDDPDDETPSLSGSRQPYIDPALLTAPTNQEIVSVLIGQKDIFPILEGVLKLVVGSVNVPPPAPTGWERRPPQQQAYEAPPPVKKRKLNRVPAGASDWDVPYPFPQGEGPDAYRKTWERERGKQLISQLIKLIKSAARKAATKKYIKERELEEQWGRQRGEMSRTQGDVLQDTSNAMVQPSANTLAMAAGGENVNANMPSLDEILGASSTNGGDIDCSMFNAYPTDASASSSLDALSGTLNNPGTGAEAGHGTGAEAMDQVAFDAWMNFLVDTFPTSFDAGANAANAPTTGTTTASTTFDIPATTSASQSHCSTPGPDEFSFANMFGTDGDGISGMSTGAGGGGLGGLGAGGSGDYDLAAMLSSIMNQPQPQASGTGTKDVAPTPATGADKGADVDSTTTLTATSTTIGDQMIDPALLALSHSFSTSNSTNTSNTNLTLDSGAGAMSGNYDLEAMLSSILNQPLATTTAPATAISTTTTTPNLNPDSGIKTKTNNIPNLLNLNTNLDLGLINMNVNAHSHGGYTGMDNGITSTSMLVTVPASTSSSSSLSPPLSTSASTSTHRSASPIASASTSSGTGSGNDPATPASAGWDMLPDVYMDVGGDSGGGDQGMWRSTMWSNFGEMAHGPMIDWDSLGMSMDGDTDVQDFGVLPDVNAGMYAVVGTTTTTKVGAENKGKGKAPALTPISTGTSTRVNTPVSAPTITTAQQSTLRALLSLTTPAPAPSLADATFLPTSTAALESARQARKARKNDIVRRVLEKRKRVQEELDSVKMRLWETTVEQAGLVHLMRSVTEAEGAGETESAINVGAGRDAQHEGEGEDENT